MIRKVHIPRWSVRGVPLATFHPKDRTSWNCRTSPLFLRKWRGLRIRGKGWQYKRDCAIDEAFRFLGWKA
jgi:hypothetical protein